MKIVLKDKNSAGKEPQIGEINKFTKLHYSAINGKKLVLFRSTCEQQKIESGYIIRQGGLPMGPITLQTNIQQWRTDASDGQKAEFLNEDSVAFPEIVTEKLTDIPNIDEEPKPINLRYPLIPRDPKGGRVFAYAHIFFDQTSNELIYSIVEPAVDDGVKKLIENIKFYIQEKIDVNFAQVRGRTAEGYVAKLIENALRYFKERNKETCEAVKYYVLRDFVGLEIIEPLMQDANIEDISCDGVNIPIYVYHRDSKIGSIKTNIKFTDRDVLDAFVSKVAERCGKSISVARPLLDGTLPNGSRVQATLGSDIARHGSNFTIRMFTENPLTPVDMVKYGTSDLKMMSYFWFLVERGASFLISGGTATGKTSFLNALSLFIKPQMKIVSIEDTAELRLPHSHWVPEVARTPLSEQGTVDMYELLRESLRQRPDFIIVGEVRGKEAFVLFQQMSIGHPGMATIHSDNMNKLIDRLTTAPINLSPNLIQNLDVIIFLRSVKIGRRYIRRIVSVIEVLGYDKRTRLPVVAETFKWNPKNDEYVSIKDSVLLKRTADKTGITNSDVKQDLENRSKVLEWMMKNDMKDYRKVSSIINLFYTSQDFLVEKIREEV
ncbi:MAG: type II/IV secretion system ATPase subunit [Candidatus Aenigmarchaeota archaeon]|nr:type II/IV secretion system ATPase subunit [Candidatus Aenigmarchaeota archaeon]